MANNKVKHYRTDVAGRKPEASKMLEGEIAINMTDKSIFTKRGTEIVNIGNGADSIVEGGQTFIGDVQANKFKSDTDVTLQNAEKSSVVFADEFGKTKVELKSEKQTDADGSLKVTVSNGKNADTGSSTYEFKGNGRLKLPVAPVDADNATRKDYVDAEILKVSNASGTNLTALEKKVDANDLKQTEANTELDNRLNTKIDLNNTTINTKVDANKADADAKIKAVNDRLTVDNQTLTDMINTKVSKAGDTMTGDLNLPKLNADGIKANYINLGPNPNTLGSNSIMMGDSDTGLKWFEDGKLAFMSNSINVFNTENGLTQFNRLLNIRHLNDASETTTPPSTGSLIRNETWTDGNNIGDGNSYIGLVDNSNNYNHYFRGKGATFIDTHQGLRVGGPVILSKSIHYDKAHGVYDSESMVSYAADPANAITNYLRKFKATAGDATWHELVTSAIHHDGRLSNSLTWLHGNDPSNFIAALNTSGTFRTNKFEALGGSNAVQLNTTSNGSAYIGGNIDGRVNAWLIGKSSEGNNLQIYNNMANDVSKDSSLLLEPGSVGIGAAGGIIGRFFQNRFEMDGSKWAATNGHAWADQWNQRTPFLIDFGSQPGSSDYYPGYGLQSHSAGNGWPTRVEIGMIRDQANANGKGVLRVASTDEEGRKDIAANYIFDVFGGFFATGFINAPRIETKQVTSFGINTNNVLGGNSIAFGDADTGFRQRTDGNLEILANSAHVATFNAGGLTTLNTIGISSPNESRGIYVHNVRSGGANSMIQGQVNGWADWGAWRDRPAGMIVEAGKRDMCINIWKSVHWGTEWSAGMDVYNPTGAPPMAQLHIGGAGYSFDGNGTAGAVQWVSTSDKRLKSNFEAIENAVDKVNALTGYVYDKKSDLKETEHSFSVREAGIIAQELQEVLPEAVSSFGEDEILGVNSAAVNALLVNAIKELNSRLAILEAK
ncbi:tail fiber domain-containing protein [Escherichia coli]|nr:tail fiber domain-containing protein [Escherichia coli]EJI1860917.1 tail fiber domain-containing protein [Escherichia coli]